MSKVLNKIKSAKLQIKIAQKVLEFKRPNPKNVPSLGYTLMIVYLTNIHSDLEHMTTKLSEEELSVKRIKEFSNATLALATLVIKAKKNKSLESSLLNYKKPIMYALDQAAALELDSNQTEMALKFLNSTISRLQDDSKLNQ